MKVLIATLVTLGIFSHATFARETFEAQREHYVTELKNQNASSENLACAENAKNNRELNKCKKMAKKAASQTKTTPDLHKS